jgi:hypothetical protein
VAPSRFVIRLPRLKLLAGMSPRGQAIVRTVAIYAFAAFLLALGIVAFVVGVHDAALATADVDSRLFSAALVGVGVVLVLAGARLLGLSRRGRWEWGLVRPPCRPIVLVGFLLAILVGIYVFFSAIGTEGAQRIVVVCVAVVIVGVGYAGLSFFGSDARVTLPRVGAIALGLIGTTLGAWQFWYENQYAPERAGRAVALRADLQLAGKQSAHNVIRATVGYEGIGGTSVWVIGSTYTLTGSRLVRCHRRATPKRVREVFGGFLADPQRTRFMADAWEIQPATVLAAGKFVGDGKLLEPNVPAGRSFMLFVPRGRYQLLRLRAQLFAIPGSVQLSEHKRPEYETFKGDNYLYGFWRIDDQSWLRDLIDGRERWVVIRYALVANPQSKVPSPDLRVTARFPDATWSEGRPSETVVHKHFGMIKDARGRLVQDETSFAERQPSDASEPFAATELALENVAKPNQHDNRSVPAACQQAETVDVGARR